MIYEQNIKNEFDSTVYLVTSQKISIYNYVDRWSMKVVLIVYEPYMKLVLIMYEVYILLKLEYMFLFGIWW